MLEAKGPICLFDRGLKEERWEFREVLNVGRRNLQICLCYGYIHDTRSMWRIVLCVKTQIKTRIVVPMTDLADNIALLPPLR